MISGRGHVDDPLQTIAVTDLAATYDKLKRAVDDRRYDAALPFAKR